MTSAWTPPRSSRSLLGLSQGTTQTTLHLIVVPLLLVGIICVGTLLIWFRDVLLPFVVALFFVYLLRAPINFFSRPFASCCCCSCRGSGGGAAAPPPPPPPPHARAALNFELIGVDMLADADGGAWLLEVQRAPSLAMTSALDARVKGELAAALRALVAAARVRDVEVRGALPAGWTRCSPAPAAARPPPPPPPSLDVLAGWRARAQRMSADAAYENYLDSVYLAPL